MTSSTVDGRIREVPTLNIKDPEVYWLAKELADRTHTSMTGAVRAALQDAIERAPHRKSREGLAERLMEIARQTKAEMDAAGETFLTDDDIYDEWGLPK
jgi:antitoxin VapB